MLSIRNAWAQFSGTVTGTVVDPSGAVVPNAEMKLTNDATAENTVTATNASGIFTFPSLAPGNYHLTSTAKGFGAITIRPKPRWMPAPTDRVRSGTCTSSMAST